MVQTVGFVLEQPQPQQPSSSRAAPAGFVPCRPSVREIAQVRSTSRGIQDAPAMGNMCFRGFACTLAVLRLRCNCDRNASVSSDRTAVHDFNINRAALNMEFAQGQPKMRMVQDQACEVLT